MGRRRPIPTAISEGRVGVGFFLEFVSFSELFRSKVPVHAVVTLAMDDLLRAENLTLRSQLESLLSEARQNEQKMRRFDRIEQRLIASSSLAELIQLLLGDFKTSFELDAVTLMLVDPEYEVARLLELAPSNKDDFRGLILADRPNLLNVVFVDRAVPLLGPLKAALKDTLFEPFPGMVQSAALLPLVRHGEIIGSLNMGSRHPHRFEPGSATDFLQRLASIAAVCVESARSQERLKQIGLTDALTGVNNRRYFERRCHEEISLARRQGWPLACMFLDVDKFKRINDTQGHLAGDQVLRTVACLIKNQLRASDIIARYGGEEFVALLPQTPLRAACDIAERIRAAVEACHFEPLPGTPLSATISIGISMLSSQAEDATVPSQAEALVAHADKALYLAKEGGRNRVVSQ
ncbi:MAG TPA: DUF484 family protein [Rhodocyclaceae bacterium]|nr:DUF484 family protein [Rhodocyclaceae bacterium]